MFNRAALTADQVEGSGSLNLASTKSLPRGAVQYYESTSSTDEQGSGGQNQATRLGSLSEPKWPSIGEAMSFDRRTALAA